MLDLGRIGVKGILLFYRTGASQACVSDRTPLSFGPQRSFAIPRIFNYNHKQLFHLAKPLPVSFHAGQDCLTILSGSTLLMRTEQMQITVKFFAAPREAIGTSEIEVTVPADSTVEELLEHLVQAYPALDSYVRSLKVAVNRTYTDRTVGLQDGDEVACLPPVGGG